ncbi:hypothetical protein ACFT5C_07120 [Streptomyces sp. NPDC057116]|uniref:hypothetical protein n=1 Tax=Streptomyces sp. NPDC057116 TaxID=3346023 RepID=UPI00362BD8E7
MDHGVNAATTRVWPFAVTRSVTTGFRVVVAPDFLVDAGRYSLLHDATGGDVTEDAVYWCEYHGRQSEKLWLLYRVVHLKAADVGLEGDYAMSGPRRTPLIEGVVCRTPPTSLATEELFAEVHRRCAAEVRTFFEADTTGHPVTPSRAFGAPAAGTPLPVRELDAYRAEGSDSTAPRGRRPSRPRRLAARLLAAVRSALGLRPARHPHGPTAVRPEPLPRSTGTARPAPGWPRRAAGAAGLIVLGVVVALVVRKFK